MKKSLYEFLGWNEDHGERTERRLPEPVLYKDGTPAPKTNDPAHWSIERFGASGKRYRLRFHVHQLHWIARLDVAHADRPWRSLYWRRLWYRIGRDEQQRFGKDITAAFADIGITDPLAFVRAKHIRLVGPPPPPPRKPDIIDVRKAR